MNLAKGLQIVESSLAEVLPHLDRGTLAGKRLFITGGTGFFGFWLLSAISLLNREGAGIRTTALSRDPNRFLDKYSHFRDAPWLEFVQGNVRNFSLSEAHYDYVIHAAADTSAQAHTSPLRIFDDIVMGSRRVLDLSVHAGAKRILLVSSGAVYGPQPADVGRIPENARFACPSESPSSAYGEGKRAMELLGALYHCEHGIEPVIARCFAFVGATLPLDGHFAIGNFIRDALYADAINVKGDGTPMRSYLYGADLAIWLLQLLACGEPCVTYNVGSDQEICIRDLAHLVKRVVCPAKDVIVKGGAPLTAEPRRRYLPTIERARKSFSLDVWTSLEDAIALTASFELNASIESVGNPR